MIRRLVLATAIAFSATTSYGASTTWNGGVGNWEDSPNWSLGSIPGAGDDASIDGGNIVNSTVNLNSSRFINQLLIDAGDQLAIHAGGQLRSDVGITNNGLINLLSGKLLLNSSQTISGNGLIQLSDSVANQILATSDNITLGASQVIAGAGQLGANTIASFTNNGLVRQEGVNALRIDVISNFNNNSSVDATGSGGVTLEAGGFNGGAINVLAGSVLTVKSGATVSNTSLNTVGGTFVDIQNSQAGSPNTVFNNVALSGELRIDNGEGATFNTALDNQGIVQLNSTGNLTDFRIGSNPFAFNGPGQLVMSDHSGNRIISTSDNVTNGADHTIRGAGQLGAQTIASFTNEGTITQEGTNQLVIDTITNFTNNGTLEATGSGGIRLLASGYNLNDIDIGVGSALQVMSGAVINDSTFNMAAGTFVDINNSAAGAPNLIINNGTLNGVLKLDNGEGATFNNKIVNNGTIELNSTGATTDLRIGSNPFSFEGPGELRMSDNANNRIISTSDNVTNSADHTISGAGQLGANTIASFTNEGTITQEGNAQLVLDVISNFNNNGTLEATGAGGIKLNASTYNLNDIDIAIGSALEIVSGATINNSTFNMAAGTFVDINNSAAGAPNLIINNGTLNGLLKLDNGEGATFNDKIVNNGVIELDSTGATTDFRIGSTSFSFDGPGELRMSDNAQNRIISTSDNVTNSMDHTIRGAGQLGANTIASFTNEGTITQEGDAQLIVDVISNFTNNGTLEATGAGGIKLNASTYNLNDIDIGAGSALEIVSGATINNSTFNMAAGTFVDINNSAAGAPNLIINNGTLNGELKLDNGEGATFNDKIVNNGVIELNSTGATTDFRIGSTSFSFDGPGELRMSDNAQNRIISTSDNVTNSMDHTIRGAGQLGANTIASFTNEGTITQEGDAQLVVDVISNFTNNGTLEATGAGGIKLNASAYNLNDIDIGAGSALEIVSGATINNSTFNMAAGTFVDINNSAAGAPNLIINNGTLNGELKLDNGEGATFNDKIVNNGVIELNSTGATTDFRIGSNPFSFDGSGELRMSDSAQNRIISTSDNVTNRAGHTIRGAGQIGANTIANLTNAGSIVQEGATSLTIDTISGFNNTGTLQASGAGGIAFDSLNVTSSGSIQVDAGSSITIPSDLNQTGGSVQVEGIITVSEMHLMDSALWGGGEIQGDVFATGSTIVGLHNSLDTLDIVGDYLQGAGSTFAVDIFGAGGAGIGHDFLAISGMGDLMGDTIDVLLDFGFASGLAVGDKFDIMSASILDGGFLSVVDNLADFELIQYVENNRLWVEVAVNNINPTNVPSPPAVWLFATSLLLLGGGKLRRRNP